MVKIILPPRQLTPFTKRTALHTLLDMKSDFKFKWAIQPAFLALILAGTAGVSSCNMFSFVGPSSDAQTLSAANACFDTGNFDCATKYYEQLSSTDSDTSVSKMAFEVFDQQGGSMSNFMQFVGDVDNKISVGNALTNFAQRMNAGAGEGKRVAIWTAFNTYSNIQNVPLQQFVRFIGALSLFGEMLAETQGTDNMLHQSDIVSNAPLCLNEGASNCLTATDCGTGNSNLTATATPTPLDNALGAAAAPTEPQPSADHLNDALDSTVAALTLLNAQGKFGSTLTTLTTLFKTTAPSSAPSANYCFRYALLSQGIGYP